MQKKLNTYAADLAESFPLSNKNSQYIIMSEIRKVVEQLEYIKSYKEKDIDQMNADMEYATSNNIKHETMAMLSGSTVKLVTAKYGHVIGAPHYDENLVIDLEERIFEREFDIELINRRIAKAKEAFKQLTGDKFTPAKKRNQAYTQTQTPEERRKALEAKRAKLMAS